MTATRTLTAGKCKCGKLIGEVVNGTTVNGQFLFPGQPVRCQECRDDESREKNGWTPFNSRD